jgi:hypothetical protein
VTVPRKHRTRLPTWARPVLPQMPLPLIEVLADMETSLFRL